MDLCDVAIVIGARGIDWDDVVHRLQFSGVAGDTGVNL